MNHVLERDRKVIELPCASSNQCTKIRDNSYLLCGTKVISGIKIDRKKINYYIKLEFYIIDYLRLIK